MTDTRPDALPADDMAYANVRARISDHAVRPFESPLARRGMASSSAHMARSYQAELRADVGPERTQASPARVHMLLWSIAWLERALAAETRGALGDESATPSRVLTRQETRP